MELIFVLPTIVAIFIFFYYLSCKNPYRAEDYLVKDFVIEENNIVLFLKDGNKKDLKSNEIEKIEFYVYGGRSFNDNSCAKRKFFISILMVGWRIILTILEYSTIIHDNQRWFVVNQKTDQWTYRFFLEYTNENKILIQKIIKENKLRKYIYFGAPIIYWKKDHNYISKEKDLIVDDVDNVVNLKVFFSLCFVIILGILLMIMMFYVYSRFK